MDHVLIVCLIIIGSIVWSIFGTMCGLFFRFSVFQIFSDLKQYFFYFGKRKNVF